MNTALLSLALWVGASVLLAITFALGAAVGYRRAVEELRESAVPQLTPTMVELPVA